MPELNAGAVYGPFEQRCSMDGTFVRAHDRGVSLLCDGFEVQCHCAAGLTNEITRAGSSGRTLRLTGSGTWMRLEGGRWEMLDFTVDSFKALDDADLSEIVARLRAVRGSGWSHMADPISEIQKLRAD